MNLKDVARRWVPAPALHAAKEAVQRREIRRSGALAAFEAAGTEPLWLPPEAIAEIEAEAPPMEAAEVAARYTDDALEARGAQRLAEIRRLLGADYAACERFLETGAADAMVARALHLDGKTVLATDIQDDELDPRALRDGVPFEIQSATALAEPDASADVLYSYDSMEHIDDPEAAMAEAARVVRPGGWVYLRFGPLYWSAEGMHLGSRLRAPYASVLFERETIDAYMAAQGRDPINHDYCNGWTLAQYRALFDAFAPWFEPRVHLEHRDLSALHLIRRFPSCFRGKSDDIDAFLVGVVEILLRRRPGPPPPAREARPDA